MGDRLFNIYAPPMKKLIQGIMWLFRVDEQKAGEIAAGFTTIVCVVIIVVALLGGLALLLSPLWDAEQVKQAQVIESGDVNAIITGCANAAMTPIYYLVTPGQKSTLDANVFTSCLRLAGFVVSGAGAEENPLYNVKK